MIRKIKEYVLRLTCVLALLGGMTACDGFNINFGPGGNDEDDEICLTRCWHLKSFCGVSVDADIYIDLEEDGTFAIYQRTEELTYTVFNGTYVADEENSVLSGVYSDGTSWLSSYNYVVDIEAKELVLTNTSNSSEVSVYESSKVPASATIKSRCASVNDVKPL